MTKPKQASLSALAADINAEHKAAQTSAHTAVEHALRCGELLIEAKAKVAHDEWLPWIEANCRFSADTRQPLCDVATEIECPERLTRS